jgi:endonuclease-3
MTNEAKIRGILRRIEAAYGRPPALRRTPPVDELIRTVLSQNTNDANSLAAFAILRKRFRPWTRLLAADTRTVASAIRHAGLANIKAARIKGILGEIERREGRIDLAGLAGSDTADMTAYLRSLKGVGPKTAACVTLFSFGRPAMPVDTHIFRVAKRLGLLGVRADIEEAHRLLTAMVPKGLI